MASHTYPTTKKNEPKKVEPRNEVLDAVYDLVDSNQVLVDTITSLVNERGGEVDYYGNYHRIIDDRRRGKAVKKLDGFYKLLHMKQVIAKETCPCGKHRGIKFIDNDTVVELMCPLQWWVRRSWMAFEEGKLSQFLSSTPLQTYIKKFSLLEKK